MKQVLFFVFLILLSIDCLAQQATVISEPSDDYLLKITREWSNLTEQGDLREKTDFIEQDLEIRLWYGYGHGTTTAGILLKDKGIWNFKQGIIKNYSVADSDSLAQAEGILPPQSLEKMKDYCSISSTSATYEREKPHDLKGKIYNIDCPVIYDRSDLYDKDIEELWANLKNAGLLKLPTEDDSGLVVIDGTGFVLEIRKGNKYWAKTFHPLPGLDKLPIKYKERWQKYQKVLNILAPYVQMPHISTESNN